MTSNAIWHHRPSIAELNSVKGSLVDQLGIEMLEIGDDTITARMPVDHRTIQPMTKVLHGGASVALAETLGSTGAYLCIDPEKYLVVGLEINANHVRSVRDGWVTGIARPLHRGRSTQLWEIRITDAADKLVCISRLTLAVIEKPVA